MRRVKKPVTPSQWVQVGGGGAIYEQGTSPYQEGGWSPLWALTGQGASSLGQEMACKAAKRFASPSVVKRVARNPPERRRDGSERVKKAGWVSMPWVEKCSKGWGKPAIKRPGWEHVEKHVGGHLFDVRGCGQICIQRHRHCCYAACPEKKAI